MQVQSNGSFVKFNHLIISLVGEQGPGEVRGLEGEEVDAPALVLWVAQVPGVEIIGTKAAGSEMMQEGVVSYGCTLPIQRPACIPCLVPAFDKTIGMSVVGSLSWVDIIQFAALEPLAVVLVAGQRSGPYACSKPTSWKK